MIAVIVQDLVKELGLQRHPEGGYYFETYRAAGRERLGDGRERAMSTAIYFALARGDFSAFHRVRSDEVWHHYRGATVLLHEIDPDGALLTTRLGSRIELGERPQRVVPAGVWQAAELVADADEDVLCGCTVAPGFDFEDFELAAKADLIGRFPAHHTLISRLTR